MTTYVEITKSEHNHGGRGWEFGTCLWSPTKNRAGADRYSLMREPKAGDRVLHFYNLDYKGQLDTWLIGDSTVTKPAKIVTEPPPESSDWEAADAYYRIDLHGYSEFANPVALTTLLNEYGDQIRDDLTTNRYRFYPFNTYGAGMRTVQGIYLGRCPNSLEAILRRAIGIQEASAAEKDEPATHAEYAEARRMSRERYFFARNPSLVRAAKAHHGSTCQICGFNFREVYGELGDGYIEAHHRNPLSERPEADWPDELRTSVDGIAVLCANCHRMIHRRRPAIPVEDLKLQMAKCLKE